MKNVGITRKLDELGRVTIPMELRRNMDVKVGDPLDISIEGGRIILELVKAHCSMCGSPDDLREVKVEDGTENGSKKYICTCCAQRIVKMAKGLSDTGEDVEF